MYIKKCYKFKNGDRFEANIEVFNSSSDIVQASKNRKYTCDSFKEIEDKRENEIKRDYDWYCVKNKEEALELLRSGYDINFKDILKKITSNAESTANKVKFKENIVGFAPIVPLSILNIPNNMIDCKKKNIKDKVIDIYYDMTCSCGNNGEKILKYGKEILKIIVELEKSGYRVNLYGVQSYCDRSSSDMLIIKIKSSNQLLDIKRTSFPTMHTAFFRVIGFDWYSKFPQGKYRSGYGSSIYWSVEDERDEEEFKEFIRYLFGKNSTYISLQKIMKNCKIEDVSSFIKKKILNIKEK